MARRRTRRRSRRRVFVRLRIRIRRPGWRAFGGLAVVLGVALLVWTLHLQVAVTRHFEGRLWEIPSRIYSDVLVLRPGTVIAPSTLTARLERGGYARVASGPSRPGQYAQRGNSVEVYRRSHVESSRRIEARRIDLRFDGSRLVAMTDPSGLRLREVAFEPELLATLFGPRHEERVPVRIEDVPATLVRAVLAAEDARFYDHHGVDLRGIARAAWANVRHRGIVQGGSTITQQTVKNLMLGHQRTWLRKLREAPMALLLDARYSKERILEAYLNEVYLGQRGPVAICGVQAAARFFFGRDVRDLTLGESALIAGMIRNPGGNNPFRHPDRALERRNQVLSAMLRAGFATDDQVASARAEPLVLSSGLEGGATAPYAVDYVRAELGSRFDRAALNRDGLRIFTTLDTRWLEAATDSLSEGLQGLERRVADARRSDREALQGAVVVLEPQSGAVLALVGGRDYRLSQFNRAVQAHRQPGSCFKPFVFAAGFELAVGDQPGALTPATMLDDSPLELVSGASTWSPANYDRTFRGWVSARQALEESLNVPTVRAARRVGLDAVVAASHRLGIGSPLAQLPSLSLGAAEVTPLELAEGYATLARLGRHEPSWVIREVLDSQGRVVARHEPSPSRAIRPEAAYLVTDVLQGVLRTGTARTAASLGYTGNAAGKTGTTDGTRDAWFVGYTPEVLALTWVGFDDNGRTGLTGATGALPIWVDTMRRAGAGAATEPFEVPEGVVRRRIDPTTGGLLQRGCDQWVDEVFIAGTEPRQPCPLHGSRFRRWLRKLAGKEPYEDGPGV